MKAVQIWRVLVCISYWNMLVEFFTFVGVGKLFVFLLRKFPPFRDIMGKREFSRELYDCELCLGFWIYLFLSPFFKIKINPINNRLLNNTVLAMITTFMVFLISDGWRANFETVIMDDFRHD